MSARTARVDAALAEFTREQWVEMLVRAGVARAAAEKQADAKYGSRDTIQARELEAQAVEDKHVAEGDRIVRALGGKVVSFSQKRASKQTPGIPDRKYYFDRHASLWLFERSTFWWEAKAEWGEQSPAQKDFQAMAEACGETYVLGGIDALKHHLVKLDLCTINPDGSLEPVHKPEV